ncbi:3'5'-cyclic nucleotide phosphodiesterase domain-containing protein [Besnoitia besnoiti]|uniref:Phosphodiesterase n=1 Tax=Besnoitia besnoiti TaxID=94643 RepID=A0A2A9MKT6_BESBE|nr:3'5'-cyclic nucleotide phosphodiesterase domain-containing protein [Besnoitia besnoiti]PFH36042.1 3'5'-cyclic nucleotide phosphodiesterase domain-containing protein [Besnoitia besnoiti]
MAGGACAASEAPRGEGRVSRLRTLLAGGASRAPTPESASASAEETQALRANRTLPQPSPVPGLVSLPAGPARAETDAPASCSVQPASPLLHSAASLPRGGGVNLKKAQRGSLFSSPVLGERAQTSVSGFGRRGDRESLASPLRHFSSLRDADGESVDGVEAGGRYSVFSAQWGSTEDCLVLGRGSVSSCVGSKKLTDRKVGRGGGEESGLRWISNPSAAPSPAMSCVVAVEAETLPPPENAPKNEEGKKKGGIGVVRLVSHEKKKGSTGKVLHFRESDSKISDPEIADAESLDDQVQRAHADLEEKRSRGDMLSGRLSLEEEDEEEAKKTGIGRAETGDPGWHQMRWKLKSVWRYLSAINNDEATMKNATGPYRVLRTCDLGLFPLAFKEPRAEAAYRDFNIRRMPLRLLIMFPILCTLYAVSYVTARQFCPDCYLAKNFDGEVAASLIVLCIATVGAHLSFLYNKLELFVVILLCLLATHRSAVRVATLAGALNDPAEFIVIYPYYGINGILECFLLCFTLVTFLGVRFGYAVWATIYMLACVVPISVLSVRLSVEIVVNPHRVWVAWESVMHILCFLLIVLTLVSAYYEERKKRILFWNLRASDARLQLLEDQFSHKREKRRPLTGTPFECILNNLTEAQEELRKPGDVDREELITLMQESVNILTSSENVYQIRAEYIDNDFTRSFIRDLRMQTREKSDFVVSRFNTLATRRRSIASGRNEASSKELLMEVGSVWGADMFQLKTKLTRPLVEVGFHLLSPFALSPDVCLDTHLLRKFLVEVEKAYRSCPYHNSLHGSMVCHLSVCLLEMLRLREALGDLEEASLITAALCHDIAHPGRNNNFMVNTNTPLALTYNDVSVLENMHASLTFRLLRDRRLHLLEHLHREAYRSFRKTVIDLILSTDMKMHFEHITNFRLRRQKEEFDPMNNCEDRQAVLSMVIKAADIGHGALPWSDHERWCELVVQEFYEQGDEEKRMGLPVSFLCDRSQHKKEFFKSQVGFLDFVVKPLYEELQAVEQHIGVNDKKPIETICLRNLKENIQQWQKRDEYRKELLDPKTSL